ncbi:hypothetical protein ACOME3_000106 [Neoechinorhynchus agilis]
MLLKISGVQSILYLKQTNRSVATRVLLNSNVQLKDSKNVGDKKQLDMWDKEFIRPKKELKRIQNNNLTEIEVDFRERKRKIEEEENKIKPVDPGLLGLESTWIGPGITFKKKKKVFLSRKELRKIKRRRDMRQPHVILNHKMIANNSLKKYQVKKLPFPFKTVIDYEETLKQPLGKLWVPEVAFRKLNVPKIKTLLGTPIEPPTDADRKH